MKKLSLFMLMAVGLLISGNVGAVNQQNGRPTQEEGDVAKMTVTNTEMGTETETYYATLQDAFDDLPDNSYPATVQMIANETMAYATNSLTIQKNQNVTLDLNGCKVYASSEQAANSSLITNNGTLTIKDSQTGGLLSSLSTKAAQGTISQDGSGIVQVPYAVNVILNTGSLFVNGGTIENGTNDVTAAYCIDCCHGGYAEINDGHLINKANPCIRIHNMTSNKGANVVINGGLLESERRTIWIQADNSYNPLMTLTINGGTLKTGTGAQATWGWCSSHNLVILAEADDATNSKNVRITINGGKFYGDIAMDLQDSNDPNGWSMGWNTVKNVEDLAIINITGGEFLKNVDPATDYTGVANHAGAFLYRFTDTYRENGEVKFPAPKCITGGIFESEPNQIAGFYGTSTANGEPEEVKHLQLNTWSEYIADGYKAIPYNENPTTKWIVVPIKQENLDVNGGEINLSEQGKTLDETTDLTITPNVEENTIINVTQDTKINKLDVTTTTGKGEAQIVVKNGVTLDVGNGGIVSENNDLTTVRVETGGTLIIGTNGIDKLGIATPIEIEASEEKGSGVLIFSPNSKVEDTQKYAEVDLYTYCKQVNGKYYWQQFAIPVTGLDNSKVVKTPNQTSYVFAWDYPTYSWTQLSSWDQLNEPFAGYDMTNVSENGGVVYTFKGDLIGNQNKQLTLPHKDYCVMGNSYTAPIDIPALFDQINKEMDQTGEGTIEKTVYKYDAKAGYYVYTNELEQELDKIGIAKASFTEIKPMEGFLLNLQSGNTAGVMLNYANAVYTPAMTTNTPATAPRMNSNTDMVVAKINVKSAHAMDQMTLVESDEFSAEIENGKDAFKYLNEGANIYAFDGTNKLAMVATDNLEGTMLAFQAAEDAEYTLTFDRALNTEYVLVDMMNGNEVAMTEGNTYTFFATPNTLNPSRFMIVATAQAPTDMVNTKANKAAKGVYTITGQYLGNGEMWNELPQGIYMVNGVKVIK